MIITIDTQKDSKQDIERIIRYLQDHISMETTPMQQPSEPEKTELFTLFESQDQKPEQPKPSFDDDTRIIPY